MTLHENQNYVYYIEFNILIYLVESAFYDKVIIGFS